MFREIDLESCCDYIDIFILEDDKLLLLKSVTTSYDVVTIEGHEMYVVFTSDGSVTKRGFSAVASTTPGS